MANGGPQDPKSTYARSPDVDPILQNRLVGIADAYPGNPIVKWLVVPFARHPFNGHGIAIWPAYYMQLWQ
ncbi:hypothetical protein N7509_000861 [Penicillium cosmopolitanum]|uniref:Uncharacterized protein n=1 Tax=Penicillium cosmopolitanum TaxID=1131564 RepID=A0A9W9WB19_9EURO|nr:uncharacterized protein N7509_000861 [Penicillium cosmopolitanum]KAJ5414234.1 hypothetical protein N7509_000861 [Penicillium cosmopolitanum]